MVLDHNDTASVTSQDQGRGILFFTFLLLLVLILLLVFPFRLPYPHPPSSAASSALPALIFIPTFSILFLECMRSKCLICLWYQVTENSACIVGKVFYSESGCCCYYCTVHSHFFLIATELLEGEFRSLR